MTRSLVGARVGRIAAAACVVMLAAAPPVFAQAGDDVLERAMHDELTRSMQQLQLDGADRPYFIAYNVMDVTTLGLSATNGSMLWRRQDRSRTLGVEVRVGDRALDNSNFLDMSSALAVGAAAGELGGGELPLEDDYVALRRQIWLATDAAYKRAAASLAAKRAALTNRTRPDSLPDFGPADVTHTVDGDPAAPLPVSDLEALAVAMSYADTGASIYQSRVRIDARTVRSHYLNSEGTSYSRVRPSVTLSATARTQADNGAPLSDALAFHASAASALPSRDQLTTQIHSMYARLDSLRHATVADRYNGPVLFEGRAAAELFSERFAPALLGRRKMMMGRPEMDGLFARMISADADGFGDKVGGRVLPAFLSVVDDPTVPGNGKESTIGTYKVDDDGVPGHRTEVVKDGILRTLLTTRVPVTGAEHSTGNHRGAGVAPSNMFLDVHGGVSQADLRAKLLAEVKGRQLPYGLIVRDLGGSAETIQEQAATLIGMTGASPQESRRSLLAVYRVYPDGREEMIRGAQLSGLGLDAFKEIVAASKDRATYYAAASARSAINSGMEVLAGIGISNEPALSAYVVPSLLFDDLTVSKTSESAPGLPYSPPPSKAE